MNKQNEIKESEEDLNNIDKIDFANTLRSSIASKQNETNENQSNIDYNDIEVLNNNYKDSKKIRQEI